MRSSFLTFMVLLLTGCNWGIKIGTEEDADAAEGDSVTDRITDPGELEARDDGREDTGPEIDTGCTSSAQCDDGDPCSGQESCGDDGRCIPGSPLADGEACTTSGGLSGTCSGGVCTSATCGNGDPCDDGLFCTAVDLCDGAGSCLGSGDPCEDALDCTLNETCDEDLDRCVYDISAGTCLVDGACYNDGAPDPSNECQECLIAGSNISWTARQDGEACTGGMCCGGACRSGAECCQDSDCPTDACMGTAADCSTMSDQATCEPQTGCMWVPTGSGICAGVNACPGWTSVIRSMCTDCGCAATGCGGGTCNCRGPSYPCGNFSDPTQCGICGCSWSLVFSCTGTHFGCPTYFTSTDCNAQQGCSWSGGSCVGYTCQ